MKQLDRYLGKAVLQATALVWLLLTLLDALQILLGQLADIGRGNYELADAMLFVLLNLPGRAWQLLPPALLIGAVLGLGNLAAQRELNAFRAAGCSVARLTLAVMMSGALLVGGALLMGEGWAPHSRQLAQQLRSQAIYQDVSVQHGAGFWVREGRRFIQVTRSEADGSLSGVNIYQLANKARLASATAAASARPYAGYWLLRDVSRGDFQERRIHVERSAEVRWPHLIDVRLAQLLTRDAATLSLAELGEYSRYLRRNGSDVSVYRMNYWQRLAAPVSALTLLLLAVLLVVGPLHGRSLGQRLLAAVLVGLGYHLLTGIVAHAGLVYGLNPLLTAALLPAAVLGVLAAAGVYARRRFRPAGV